MSSCDVAAIGWVIALVGLIVNHRLTGQRDTRKEIRGELDKFLVALKVLRDAANDYYFPRSPILSLNVWHWTYIINLANWTGWLNG